MIGPQFTVTFTVRCEAVIEETWEVVLPAGVVVEATEESLADLLMERIGNAGALCLSERTVEDSEQNRVFHEVGEVIPSVTEPPTSHTHITQ